MTDGNADIEIEADTAEEAAQEYVDGGDWGERSSTIWITMYVTLMGVDEDGEEFDTETYTITLDPEEPPCPHGEHNWDSPHEVVGGCRENPGVFGHGGGVIIKEVCTHCGCGRTTDTWAQNPSTGEQGLDSVSYEPNAYELEEEDYDFDEEEDYAA